MSTITLPNIRVSSDLTVKVRLKDGGVAIDWSTLSGIRALIYSDAQRAMAGRCAVSVDAEDATLLVCQYAANKPQYIGVNRIVISATYLGEMKTYDKPALNFVRWTDDQAGQEITISDPDVEVEIEVEDVSSSILQEAVDAAFSAAERANDAAAAAEHMVDIHQGPPGPAGKSPYIDETTGNWFVWDETTQQYVDSGEKAEGDPGPTPDFSIGDVTTGEPGDPAAASITGTPAAPVLNLTIPKGDAGVTPNITVGTVTTGEPGTSVIVTITGTAAAPVLNFTIPRGTQGNSGVSADYPIEIVNNLEDGGAAAALSAEAGKLLARNMKLLYDSMGAAAFWGSKPVIDWSGNSVPVSLTLTDCSIDNLASTVPLGDSYEATITPDAGNILGTVICTMNGEPQTVTNGHIYIAEVTGSIIITASGINLDSTAFDGLTYRQIFETNNFLGISPGFENGSISPLIAGGASGGEPTLVTDVKDSGTYSLKMTPSGGAQYIKSDNNNGSKKSGWCACRAKVTAYTQGGVGIQYDPNYSVYLSEVSDWKTIVFFKSASSTMYGFFVGSFGSPNLTGYIDTPVAVLQEVFTNPPTTDQFTELYNNYVAIKKAA